MFLLNKFLHQSWGVVSFAIGIIAGSILGLIFRINYFGSPLWILFSLILFIFMYLKPRFLTVGLCLIAGLIIAFFRVATILSNVSEVSKKQDESKNFVIDARDWFAGKIENRLPEREAKLGMSYLLGMKTEIDDKLAEDLKTVGLTHIVVASGAHLSILVEIARKIFGRLSRFSGLLFSILFILFFMTMVGFTPSILRAGVMSILTLISWYVGRKIVAWRMILMVMAFTLILNPTFLTNIGWLLSFASYAGIMLLGPLISKFFYGSRKPGFIASVVLTTIAATLMTLPITLYYFGQVSIISVIANLLILPTLPYAMGLVFLVGIFAGVPGIEEILGFLAEKILNFHILTVEFFGSMEQFLVKVEPYNPWMFTLYLIILLPFLWRFFRWTRDKKNGKIKISKNINFLE